MHGAYIYDIFSRLEKFEKNFTVQNRQICMVEKTCSKSSNLKPIFFAFTCMHACKQV